LQVSSDGLIRLTIDELFSVALVHLVSGVDADEPPPTDACGRMTAISGYTEWASAREPAISIGWDWRIQVDAAHLCWKRAGMPRTNIMLVDVCGNDSDWQCNLQRLATVVDALPWLDEVPQAVAARYA
jgi:hypothetical protein